MRILLMMYFTLFIAINSGFGKDSSIVSLRLKNSIELIKNDSLFQAHLVNNCSKEVTFCLDDSTSYPLLFAEYFMKLYPNLSRKDIIPLWKKITNVDEYYCKREYIVNNPVPIIDSCTYQLTLAEVEPMPDLWLLYVSSLICRTNKVVVFYIKFNNECQITQFISANGDFN